MARSDFYNGWRDVRYGSPAAAIQLLASADRSRDASARDFTKIFDDINVMQQKNAESQSKANTGTYQSQILQGQTPDKIGPYDSTALAETERQYLEDQLRKRQVEDQMRIANARLGISQSAENRQAQEYNRGIQAENALASLYGNLYSGDQVGSIDTTGMTPAEIVAAKKKSAKDKILNIRKTTAEALKANPGAAKYLVDAAQKRISEVQSTIDDKEFRKNQLKMLLEDKKHKNKMSELDYEIKNGKYRKKGTSGKGKGNSFDYSKYIETLNTRGAGLGDAQNMADDVVKLIELGYSQSVAKQAVETTSSKSSFWSHFPGVDSMDYSNNNSTFQEVVRRAEKIKKGMKASKY